MHKLFFLAFFLFSSSIFSAASPPSEEESSPPSNNNSSNNNNNSSSSTSENNTSTSGPSVNINISRDDHLFILYKKSYDLVYEKKYTKAIKLLEKVIKRKDLNERTADFYNLLGYSYRKQSNPDLDKSYSFYMIALEADPNHIPTLEYLSELYVTLGKENKSKELLEKIQYLDNNNSSKYPRVEKKLDY